jgi:dolichol-phosphate mannosyltransferase
MTMLSLIIPIYNEEDSLAEFYQRANELKQKIHPIRIQMVFVDDGSTDGSLEILKKMAVQDKEIMVISFSRNFGSHAAIRAGTKYAEGDAAVIISVDLQDPPEIIEKMVTQWQAGSDIVWAVRESRNDPLFKKTAATLYSQLMRKFALANYFEKGADFCLLNRKVYRFVASEEEKNTNVFGLILWSGFKQSFISYKRQSRKKGVSKWNLSRKVKLFVDSFVSFSFFPIRLISYLGFIFSLIACVYVVALIINYLKGVPVQGWTSLAALVSGGFALLFSMAGI